MLGSYIGRRTERLAETVECGSLQEVYALYKCYFVWDGASDSWEILLAGGDGLPSGRIYLFFLGHLPENHKSSVPDTVREHPVSLFIEVIGNQRKDGENVHTELSDKLTLLAK
jgi:hypothetical protein